MLYGDNMRMRAAERSDIPRFVRWLNDPDVTAGLLAAFPFSIAEEELWFEGNLKKPQEERVMVIEIYHNEAWLPVGNCGLHNFDHRVHSAELGIFIGEKSFWDQGIGTRAMQLLMRHAFKTLNLNRLALRVFASNLRAIHVYEKVGFTHEGRLRQALYKDGVYIDELIMSVLRAEYAG